MDYFVSKLHGKAIFNWKKAVPKESVNITRLSSHHNIPSSERQRLEKLENFKGFHQNNFSTKIKTSLRLQLLAHSLADQGKPRNDTESFKFCSL